MYYVCTVAKLKDGFSSVHICTFVPEILMEINFHKIVLHHEKKQKLAPHRNNHVYGNILLVRMLVWFESIN